MTSSEREVPPREPDRTPENERENFEIHPLMEKIVEGDLETLAYAVDILIGNPLKIWKAIKKERVDPEEIYIDTYFLSIPWWQIEQSVKVVYYVMEDKYPAFRRFSEKVNEDVAEMAFTLYDFFDTGLNIDCVSKENYEGFDEFLQKQFPDVYPRINPSRGFQD